jgi:hypothetical protein
MEREIRSQNTKYRIQNSGVAGVADSRCTLPFLIVLVLIVARFPKAEDELLCSIRL